MKWSNATSDIFECVQIVKRMAAEKREASYSARAERSDRLKDEADALMATYQRAIKQLEAL